MLLIHFIFRLSKYTLTLVVNEEESVRKQTNFCFSAKSRRSSCFNFLQTVETYISREQDLFIRRKGHFTIFAMFY